MSYRNIVRCVAMVCIAALAIAPAALGKPKSPKPGGKKPIGEVTSFESGELTVDMYVGEPYEGRVADDVQVKLEHRGNHDRGGNPSNGTVEDIEVGAKVLRMKVSRNTELVEKIRLRPAPEAECQVEDPEDEVEEPEDAEDCPDEEVVEEGEPEGEE